MRPHTLGFAGKGYGEFRPGESQIGDVTPHTASSRDEKTAKRARPTPPKTIPAFLLVAVLFVKSNFFSFNENLDKAYS